jgi:DNA primase large subunit
MTAKALPRMDEDTRLEPILDNLSQGFIAGIGSEWGADENTGEGIRAEMVDELAHKHFPMCMRNLHENLKRNHHLKHFGRLQYGLFLKVTSCVVGRPGLVNTGHTTGFRFIYRRGLAILAQVFQRPHR